MLKIGTHQSVAGGYLKMGQDALHIQANTFQFFARNPRGAKAKEVTGEEWQEFYAFIMEHRFMPVVIHAPYTMNPCSSDGRVRELAEEMMVEDLSRLENIPGNYYNFHPGSHVQQGIETAVDYIASMLNRVMCSDMHTTVLLETMSGKGSEVGSCFEELRMIIDKVICQKQIGVCMDACHMWDAGYDIVNNLDGVLEEFDRIIGLDKLYAFHINDSLNPCGSRKDRHALLGEGHMGMDAIIRIISHQRLRHLPFILETPTDLEGHAEEIKMLRGILEVNNGTDSGHRG